MENKLEQLTQKLRAEGLERGRTEAEAMVAEANANAERIVKEAKQKAEKIIADANAAAQELTKNTANDVRMASLQTISTLRSQIEDMVVASVVEPKVSDSWANGDFVKSLIVEAVKSWNSTSDTGVEVVVPDYMVEDVRGVIAQQFQGGVDVIFDGKVRVPFRIAPREGGYYVSFSDEDFAQLIKQALRPRVAEFIFG